MNKWINVKDELPNSPRKVRTVEKLCDTRFEIHNRYNHKYSRHWDKYSKRITHWQEIELPEEDLK